ncbi:tyrosine-type recombinase/integrase [Embleya sp. NPDC001921]
MPNDRGRRRDFGAIRKLPSGRFQVRYPHPETGEMIPADRTFETLREAEDHLAEIRTDIRREDWRDPEAGKQKFGKYATAWIAEHPKLEVSTRELYEILLRLHIGPTFNDRELQEIKLPHVRAWRQRLLDNGRGQSTVAKSYRLLRGILNTAVADDAIKRNPCRIKGAGDEKTPERPTLTIDEVFRVADAIDARYRAMVLIATFLGLRLGELAGLRRKAVDLENARIRVRRVGAQSNKGTLYEKDPKTEAGKRWITIPEVILPDIKSHLEWFAEKTPDGLLFVGPRGGLIRRNNFNRVWKRALRKAKVTEVHFHDLRHTGNTLAASTGASTRELMARMGHASPRAALIYQHATNERDREIADALSAKVRAVRRPAGAEKTTPKSSKSRDQGRAAGD